MEEGNSRRGTLGSPEREVVGEAAEHPPHRVCTPASVPQPEESVEVGPSCCWPLSARSMRMSEKQRSHTHHPTRVTDTKTLSQRVPYRRFNHVPQLHKMCGPQAPSSTKRVTASRNTADP